MSHAARADGVMGSAAEPAGLLPAAAGEAGRGLYVRWRATSQAHIAVKTLRQDFSVSSPVRLLSGRSRNTRDLLDLDAADGPSAAAPTSRVAVAPIGLLQAST